MWLDARREFERYLQPDTACRLEFNDDGPTWSVWQEDGTETSIFAATPGVTFTDREPTFQAVVVHNKRPNGTEGWQISTFEAPHPGSFKTSEQQFEGFFGPLNESLESIEPADIDRELNLRYLTWRDRQ